MRSWLRDVWEHWFGKVVLVLAAIAAVYLLVRLTLPLWAGLADFLRLTMPVWTTFLLAFLFAYLLNPVVVWLAERGVPRGAGVALLVVGLLGGLISFWLLVVTIAADLSAIVREFPGLVEGLRELPFRLARIVDPTYGDVFDQVFTTTESWSRHVVEQVLPSLAALEGVRVTEQVSSLLGGGFQIAMVLVLTVFFLLRFDSYAESFLAAVPERHRSQVGRVAAEVGWAVGGYVRGQLIIALAVGIMTYIGLAVIGVPLARALGVMAGLLNVVPFFGPILVSVPTALVAFTVGWAQVLGALAVLVIVNQIDAHVLSPIILSHTVEIDPATILLAIFLGTVLFGLLGAILAVPAAVLFRFGLRETYFRSRWYRGRGETARE